MLSKDLFIWDAVVAWRNHIYQADFYNTTKGNYLTGMLKLIESKIINERMKLINADDEWIEISKKKIDDKLEWSVATKTVRKSCLNSLYNFILSDFNKKTTPYGSHPKHQEIKHILSNVHDVILTKDIRPVPLFNALKRINNRDAYIVLLMMWTGQTLESILDRRKEHFRTTESDEETKTAYLDFEDENGTLYGKHILENIAGSIIELSQNSKVYLFETSRGNRIIRTQIMRNLKQAGYNIGLGFDLTPRVLHGYVHAYMSCDKRSELEKAMGFSIN